MNELIRILSEIRCEYNLFDPDEAKYYSALSEAIRLVSGLANLQPTCNQLATDLISRQAVIDALCDNCEHSQAVCAHYPCKQYVTIEQLPSAQPEPIRINLNEPIKVKLTDWGKEIYYHQYDRINQIAGREVCKPSFPKEDENGCVEFQLWYFMELYGEYMGMAMPNVINPLEIVYKS